MRIELPAVFLPEGEAFKYLATLKRRVSKNFRWTSLGSVQDAVCLAYCLYIAGREDQALETCRFLGQMPASNDAKDNIKAWLQNVLALQSRLARRAGFDSEVAECQERIRLVSTFDYRMTGEILRRYEGNVQYALDDAAYSKSRERDWRLNVLIELVVMLELGVSSCLTAPSLEEKLNENMMRLQRMICQPVE